MIRMAIQELKNIFPFLLLISLSYSQLFAAEPASSPLKIGEKAPTFYLKDVQNNDIFLRDYCGEKLRKPWKNKEKYVVVLSFWATWCGPCQKEIPVLQHIMDEYSGKKVKAFLIAVGEKKEKVAPFAQKKKFRLPVLLDIYSVVSTKKYQVPALPRLFVIDQNGIIRHMEEGFKNEQHLRSALKAVLDKLLSES